MYFMAIRTFQLLGPAPQPVFPHSRTANQRFDRLRGTMVPAASVKENMKPLLRAMLFASCAAIVVTGCGMSSARPQLVSAFKAANSPRQRAEADAAAIRASFVPPPGARRLTAAPDAGEGVLKHQVDSPGTPDLVDAASWWLAPGQPTAVLAWEKAHLRRRFTSAGYGSTGQTGVWWAWYDEFALPAVPAVLDSRELIVEVASAGNGQTAIRAEAQVTWLPAKPAAERVPAAAESVTISALPPDYQAPAPPAPVTITNRDEVRRIASLADGLPVWPPGEYNCGPDRGYLMMLTFRGAGGGTLAVVAPDPTGCGTVSFTVGGKKLLTLAGGSLEQQVLAVAGLHWPQARIGS
jgi:hypothetical protein